MRCDIGKRERNRQRKRAAIVEIATRSFLDHGYMATSMSAIADELGGSKGTLWAHFSSKEELFSAVLDERVAQFASTMEDTLSDKRFSLESLRRYCRSFAEALMAEDAIKLFRLIIGDGGRFPEINEMFHTRGPAKVLRMATEFFATRFEPEEAAQLATITNSAISGFRAHILTRGEPPAPAELDRFVESLIAHLRLPELESEPELDER